MESLLPKIIFDKITLTSDNSKTIVVDDPHIQSAKEGTFKRESNVFSSLVELSAFELGDELAQSGWLSLLTEFSEYLPLMKIAFAITYKKQDSDDFVKRINNNDISLPYSIIVQSKQQSTAIKANIDNLVKAVPSGISYATFGFESLGTNLNLSQFLDINGNYKVPIKFRVFDIPRNIEHMQIFAFPYLDLFEKEELNINNANDASSIKRRLEQTLDKPYGYTLNVVDNSKVQNLQIINNTIIADEIIKLKLKLPKDTLIDKLSLNYEKVLKGEAISELFVSKNEFNQQTLFFFVNKNKLITNNSIFSNSFKNGEQIPASILNILKNATFNLQLVKTEQNENDIKITKNNKYLNITNYATTDTVNVNTTTTRPLEGATLPTSPPSLSSPPTISSQPPPPGSPGLLPGLPPPGQIGPNVNNPPPNFVSPPAANIPTTTTATESNYTFKYISNVFGNIDLYYFTEQLKDNYNVTTTYGLDIRLFDPLVDELRKYDTILKNNLSNLNDFLQLVNKPFNRNDGYYDFKSNTIKNINNLDQVFETININSNFKYYKLEQGQRLPSTLSFTRQIRDSFIESLNFINDLFLLNLDTTNLKDIVSNSVNPLVTNLEGIQFVINLHKNLIENLSPILNKANNTQSKQAVKNGVNVINQNTSAKFFITLEHKFNHKTKTTFYNDFKINNLLFNAFNYPLFKIQNLPYPFINPNNVPKQPFYAQNVKLYKRDLPIRSTDSNLDAVSTDSAKFLFMFYNDLINNSITAESNFEFSKDLDDINFDSVSAVLANKFNISTLNIFYDDETAKEQINNFSYKSLSKFDSNRGIEYNAEQDFSSDKTKQIINQLETARGKAKIDKKYKVSNVSVTTLPQIVNSVDYLIYDLALRNTGITITQLTSVQSYLPIFKIQILNSFENNNLSNPIWQDFVNSTKLLPNSVLARIVFTTSNDEYVKKALKNFEYPNKYFIITTGIRESGPIIANQPQVETASI